jgi:hypothetical protein
VWSLSQLSSSVPIQPSSSSVAWITVVALFVLGAALYAVACARVTSVRDE